MTGDASQLASQQNYHRRRCHQYGGHRATMPPPCPSRPRAAEEPTIRPGRFGIRRPFDTTVRAGRAKRVDTKPPNIHVNPRSSREGVV
ncbi:hypothetical protein P5V15_006750 [Pogonomyrmex californicus]